MVEIRDLSKHVGESVDVRGWVEATRGHGKVAFVTVRDGTGVVQAVLVKSAIDEASWSAHAGLTPESLVRVTGQVKAEPRAPGGYELGLTGLELLALAEPYPIQPKSTRLNSSHSQI